MALPQFDLAAVEGPVAVLETTKGTVKIQLFPAQAPKTVENFVGLIEKGYYDGIIFHRVISDFMIQGGDPTGTGMGGESLWGDSFEDEFSDEVFNLRGALSMANAGPNTNGSQFFINQNSDDVTSKISAKRYPEKIYDAYKKGGNPTLDGSYTVFGQVISGMDVVDKIASVATDDNDKPTETVTVTSVEVVKDASSK